MGHQTCCFTFEKMAPSPNGFSLYIVFSDADTSRSRFNFRATLSSQLDHGVRGKWPLCEYDLSHWFGVWEISTFGNKIEFPNWKT